MLTTQALYAQVLWRRLLLVAVLGLAVGLIPAPLVAGARSATQPPGLIAFTADDGVYVMRADGSRVRRLWHAEAWGLAWSPDGRRLAVAGSRALWVVNADGSRSMPVTRVVAGSVTWSPDGRRIAFTARRAVGEPATIWVMNAEGGHVRRLELAPGISANNVDWSPVGSRLVFDTGGWVPKIYTVDADGGNLHLLTRNAASSEQPEWSANGRRIVFVRDHRVWTMNAYGRSPAGLTGEVGEAYPVWSPDGRKLAFVCWTTGDVYVMNADGTSRTKLEHNRLIERTLDWQPVAAP